LTTSDYESIVRVVNAPRNTDPRQATTVRLSADTLERLAFLADAEHRTRSALIEILIVEALDARDLRAEAAEVLGTPETTHYR
jgi:hypothetical protein